MCCKSEAIFHGNPLIAVEIISLWTEVFFKKSKRTISLSPERRWVPKNIRVCDKGSGSVIAAVICLLCNEDFGFVLSVFCFFLQVLQVCLVLHI